MIYISTCSTFMILQNCKAYHRVWSNNVNSTNFLPYCVLLRSCLDNLSFSHANINNQPTKGMIKTCKNNLYGPKIWPKGGISLVNGGIISHL